VLAVAHHITSAAAAAHRGPLYFLAAAAAGAAAAGAAAGAFAALAALGALADFAGAERALGAPRGAALGFSAPTAGMPPLGRPVLFLALAFLGAAAFFFGAAWCCCCYELLLSCVCSSECKSRESVSACSLNSSKRQPVVLLTTR
jgi:hypothetical protein